MTEPDNWRRGDPLPFFGWLLIGILALSALIIVLAVIGGITVWGWIF